MGEETKVLTVEEVQEEEKKNFFISLFSADGSISSKRVGGLFLLTIAGASGILSLFKELSDQALTLNSTLGWMGLALLGVNVLPEVIKGIKK
jgi:gamma-glutamylcysteine synthetase